MLGSKTIRVYDRNAFPSKLYPLGQWPFKSFASKKQEKGCFHFK